MEVALKDLMHNRSFFLRAFVLFILSAVLGTNVLAQSTAALSGTVSDPTGAVIASAKVIATNQATGIESTTQNVGETLSMASIILESSVSETSESSGAVSPSRCARCNGSSMAVPASRRMTPPPTSTMAGTSAPA